MTSIQTVPSAVLRHEEDLPFVDLGGGVQLQVLQVDLANGVWVIRNRFEPGATIQTHRHTGSVLAFTISGAWHYLENSGDVNRAGSYLFEPAGSVHTLRALEDNDGLTDAWFAITGANLNLNEAGEVEQVIDAGVVLSYYRAACATEHGIDNPPVVVLDA